MKTLVTKNVRVETRKEIKLTDGHLRELIRAVSGDVIPAHADIYIEVPGGGDWSNTSLDVCAEHPIIIFWAEVTTND